MSIQKTTVDWLRFRTRSDPGQILEAFRPMFGDYADMLHLGDLGRGLFGFKTSIPILLADVPVARLDYGGESQRDWVRVDVPGKGCGFVADWDAVDSLEELPAAELRRTDIALTTWEGQITHDLVVQAHQDGRFTTNGRPPNLRTIVNSTATEGRTCYIGQRTSDKFLRCYEKGYELAGKMPGLTHVDGFPVEDIYRVELELKAENTVVPWDVIGRRDQYFAGSYPFCADILPGVEADILQRRPERAPQRELAAALENLRTQYGATLYTALRAYHGDIGAVWDKVVGTTHNRHLLEAGVLLVEHD